MIKNSYWLARHRDFEAMLKHICLCAIQTGWETKTGRPRLPLNDMLYASVTKVVLAVASRPHVDYLTEAQARGLIVLVPTHSSISRFLNEAATRQWLIRAILCASDMFANAPHSERPHKQVRFTGNLRILGRSYDTLINEALCAKLAEMVFKCCLKGVQIAFLPVDENSLLSLLESQIPSGLPREDRDELYQEMVVAALDGTMRPDQMRGYVGTLLRRVRQFHPSRFSISDDGADRRPLEDRLVG